VVEESEAADHGVAFCSVGPGIEARDGAAAFGEPIAKRVGNYPAGGSDAVVVGRRHC
jgi:hypothetical protein